MLYTQVISIRFDTPTLIILKEKISVSRPKCLHQFLPLVATHTSAFNITKRAVGILCNVKKKKFKLKVFISKNLLLKFSNRKVRNVVLRNI